MDAVLSLLVKTFAQVTLTFQHNWPFLAASLLISALLKLYVKGDAIAAFLRRYRQAGVAAATAAAVGTPLCSCGTTAIVLGMLASQMPWAPVVAFMVASPLTSPEELVYSAGLFGWPFALAFFLASIFLGLAGGAAAGFVEGRGWLKGQLRFPARQGAEAGANGVGPNVVGVNAIGVNAIDPYHAGSRRQPPYDSPAAGCACSETVEGGSLAGSAPRAASCCTTIPLSEVGVIPALSACGCDAPAARPAPVNRAGSRLAAIAAALPGALPALGRELAASTPRFVVMFFAFAFAGYLLNNLIPSAWITALFGSGRAYSVPLAATLGLPFYINTEASLPLVRGLLEAGMSQGAALAFLISGAGTSVGAIAGALAIARWRVVALVAAVLWAGAILSGFAFDLILALHLF